MTKEMDIDLEIEADEVAYIYLGTDKHNNLKNLDLPDSHPIRAITGLQEVVDKVGRTEDGAEINRIIGVRVNGTPLDIAEDRTVDVPVPTSFGYYLDLDGNNGVISLKDRDGVVLSTIDTNLERIIKSGYYDAEAGNIVLVTDDNTKVEIPVSDLVDTYAADGTYLKVENRIFSMTEFAKRAVDAVATKANDSDVIHKDGNEKIFGSKTFENPIVDPRIKSTYFGTPNANASDNPYYLIGEFEWSSANAWNSFIIHLKISTTWGDSNNNSIAEFAVKLGTTTGGVFSNISVSRISCVSDPRDILSVNNFLVFYNSNTNMMQIWMYVPYEQMSFIVSLNESGSRYGIYSSQFKFYDTISGQTSAPSENEGWVKAECKDLVGIAVASTPTDAVGKEIVTADWALANFASSKQPYVVAFDPAVAVTNATTCIKYQGHCASYTKPVMSNNVLNRGSWTDDEYLLKRMQYCTFRPDGTIKEVLYKNDLTKVWIKNYADGTPDTPIYANGELMEFCATQTQPSEIPSDATESSITTLDTMLVIPTLYTYGDERGFRVSYDPSQGSAEAHTLDGHVYKYEAIGVYLASNSSDGTTIMSVSDAEPLRSTSRYAFRGKLVTKDQINGKWKLFNYFDSRMFKLLAYLIGGSLDSQAVFGAGLSSGSMGINVSGETEIWRRNYATYTGKTNTVGMLGQSTAFTQKFDADKYGVYDNGNTTQVRQVKFLIEAPWSQDWQFMDDTCYEPSTGRFLAGTNSASVIHSADDNNGLFFTNQVANPTLMEHVLTITDTDGLPGMIANPNGAYSSMLRTEDKAWGMPVNKVGSSTTGACDGWWMQPRTVSEVGNSVFGGGADYGLRGGVACWSGFVTLSTAWIFAGARACFLFD